MSKDLTKRWNEDIKDYEADTEFNIYDHFTDATGFTIPFLHARKKFVHEYNRKMMELRVAMRGEQKEALTKYSFARLVYRMLQFPPLVAVHSSLLRVHRMFTIDYLYV